MQITDLGNQYNQNMASGVETSSGTKGLKQVISAFEHMAAGNVFEGSIKSMEDGVVTLGLSNGQTIQAKLDSSISLSIGQTLFFQVKSNNGTQIAIRPMLNGVGSNPTLLQALEAAGLSVNAKNLAMVDAMMKQSMPIDKQSLQDMARLMINHPDINVTTLVEMSSLKIPVTEEMAAQFENYKSDQHAILGQLEHVMEELPEKLVAGTMTTDNMLKLNRQMIEILTGKILDSPNEMAGMPSEDATLQKSLQPEESMQKAVLDSKEAVGGKILLSEELNPMALTSTEDKVVLKEALSHEAVKTPVENGLQQEIKGEILLKDLFSAGELKQLNAQLAQIPELSSNPNLITEEGLKGELSAKELLQLVGEALANGEEGQLSGLKDFISSKQYRKLLINVMEQQWLVRPQDLKGEHRISELYEGLERQMNQLEQVLKAAGEGRSRLSDTAGAVRNNIEFMNQINQHYTYVQIPLKMAGKNVHSDLYVYTDKKKLRKKDGEFTAFLHLDMEHLGATDVSIRMQNKNITTRFYLEDDTSFALLQEHLGELQKSLENKGYLVTVHVENQEKNVNFVEDFLKKEAGGSQGMVHRYSFDVRA